MNPRSNAATVDRRCIAMFVGEVLIAIIGVGSSWKLSGGSHLLSEVTKLS